MRISADDYRVVDSQVLVDHPRVRITMDTLEHDGERRAHLILGGGIAARAAIATVALTPDRQLVLTRQYRHALRAVITDLPAGRLDPDEEPIEGARRELEEETGYRSGRIIYLGKFYQFPSTIDVPTHLFFADDLTATHQHLDEGEELEVVLTPVPEVLAMIERGEVVDGSLQLGVLLAKHRGLLPEGSGDYP